MNAELPKPGWYPAAGDPPNTLRYWDGELWVGEPVGEPVTAPSTSTGSDPVPYVANPQPQPNSSQAVTALIVGIVGLVLCQLASPFAWKLGRDHIKRVDAGVAPAGDRNLALIGMILGIVGTALIVLAIVAIAVIVFVSVATTS